MIYVSEKVYEMITGNKLPNVEPLKIKEMPDISMCAKQLTTRHDE